MRKKHLKFEDETSSKFWNVETSGASLTVSYGRIGTVGQSKQKTFADAAACSKEAEKLLQQKLKKGYVETKARKDKRFITTKSTSAQRSDDWVEYFAYLADTDGYQAVLEAIMKRVTKSTKKGKQLTLWLDGLDEPMVCSPPAKTKKYAKHPESFRKLVRKHELISVGDQVQLGDTGTLDFGIFGESDPVYELFGGDPWAGDTEFGHLAEQYQALLTGSISTLESSSSS